VKKEKKEKKEMTPHVRTKSSESRRCFIGGSDAGSSWAAMKPPFWDEW
jgi:hypothetical protein